VSTVATQQIVKPYQQSVDAVLTSLGTDALRGLSDAEAQTRLRRDGPNELIAEKPVPAWRKFLAQFSDALVILLLIATAISAILWGIERDQPLPYEAIAILVIVFLNALLGYIQESAC
jgi:Ca2+-transporting ATPase